MSPERRSTPAPPMAPISRCPRTSCGMSTRAHYTHHPALLAHILHWRRCPSSQAISAEVRQLSQRPVNLRWCVSKLTREASFVKFTNDASRNRLRRQLLARAASHPTTRLFRLKVGALLPVLSRRYERIWIRLYVYAGPSHPQKRNFQDTQSLCRSIDLRTKHSANTAHGPVLKRSCTVFCAQTATAMATAAMKGCTLAARNKWQHAQPQARLRAAAAKERNWSSAVNAPR